MWIIIPLAIAGALLVVLLIDIISRRLLKNKLNTFLNNYKLISLGMTKQQVVTLLGSEYTQNATENMEILSWTCDTNTAIQRELYSKREAKKIVVVEISDNKVVGYSLQ